MCSEWCESIHCRFRSIEFAPHLVSKTIWWVSKIRKNHKKEFPMILRENFQWLQRKWKHAYGAFEHNHNNNKCGGHTLKFFFFLCLTKIEKTNYTTWVSKASQYITHTHTDTPPLCVCEWCSKWFRLLWFVVAVVIVVRISMFCIFRFFCFYF